jgi:hypothetical protein
MATTRTADFPSILHCEYCAHCRMWLKERRVVLCSVDGATPEHLKRIHDNSAEECGKFESNGRAGCLDD